MSDSEVTFCIFLNNRPVLVLARLVDTLAKLFITLQKNPAATKHIPAKVSYSDCKFYRLKHPVPLGEDDTDGEDNGKLEDLPDEVKRACLDETNRVAIHPMRTKVQRLATDLSDDHIYLVIEIPDPMETSNNAISKLQQYHNTLFKCLHVTVKKVGAWTPEDVDRNLQGGTITNDIDHHTLPDAFRELQHALARPRVYLTNDNVAESRDLQNALSYTEHFSRVFTPTAAATELPTVISNREFAAFHCLLRCFNSDVEMIADQQASSSLKTSNFTVHFIQPPFFSEIHDDSRGFKYKQEQSWGFPIFVDTGSAPDICRKFTPRSDWMVVSPQYEIPFVISEVISDKKKESDRCRMLVQAIALARAGQFLVKSTSVKRFFVVAMYIDANMVVSRYTVMQTKDAAGQRPVFIHQKDFQLREVDEQVDFLREMYNLTTQISVLSGELDQDKKKSLREIHDVARKVLSLNTTQNQNQTKTSGSTTMDAINEGATGTDGQRDDLGVFEAEDIQNVLRQMNYKIEFIPWGHPQLALIVKKTGDKHGYLKFVEREKEVKVLQYLTQIESPSNHTISNVRFWPVEGGTVISMPVAGGWLTSLANLNEQLWSVALQLVEGVAFMHEHNVAHLDLKPQNIIIPAEGGRLSIIDFSVSIRAPGPDTTYSGVVGTEDYIAPEVRKGHYKPMLADLWSCGRTLEELCACCHPSAERTKVLEIARRLMDRDPEARPKMSAVLEWMAPARRGENNVVPLTLPTFSTISIPPLCA